MTVHQPDLGLDAAGRWSKPIVEAQLPLMIIPTLVAGAIALWNPVPLALHAFSIASAIPLLYFYLASRSRHWDIVQVYSIVAVIFIPVSVSLGLLFDYFEHSPGLAGAQVILTGASLAVLLVLNAQGRVTSAPVRLSDRVDGGPVVVLAGLAVLFSVVIPVDVAGERLLFAAAVMAAAAGAGAHGMFRGVRYRYVALSLGLFGLYYTTVFSGFGRLLIATLGFAIVLCLSGLRSSPLARGACIAAMIPFLMVASFIETTRSADSGEIALGVGGFSEGLGSVFGPIGTFGDTIDRDLAAGRDIWIAPERSTTTGATIVAAALSPVPRALWENKPRGLGRVGVEEIYPDLRVSDEHTLAFMMFGEFYFEFGLLGVAVGVGLIVWALAAVERSRLWFVASGSVWPRERVALYAILLAGVPDLLWGGLFGVTGRTVIRVLLLVAVVWSVNAFVGRFGTTGRATLLEPTDR